MGLAEWWNDVGEGIAQWWDSQVWGSVPDWFAAIGTVGALVLGFVLLQREIGERRRELANQFVVTLRNERARHSNGVAFDKLVIRAFNGSNLPISNASFRFGAKVHGTKLLEWGGTPLETEPETGEIAPDERVAAEFAMFGDDPNRTVWFVSFVDGRGRHWIRNLRNDKYVRKIDRKWHWWSVNSGDHRH